MNESEKNNITVDLPEGWHPLEAITVIKCLDAQGDPRLAVTLTPTLNPWEALGMLTGAADWKRGELRSSFASTQATPIQEEEDDG